MTETPALKVFRCFCGARVKITARRDKMYILHCTRCRTEYGYPDDHPFFTHENALTEVGDYVIFEAFNLPKEEKTKKCKACGATITQAQAVRTFEEQGRALCEGCA